MHIIAAKAVALKEAMEPDFKTYQEGIVRNSRALAEELLSRGYDLVSGGTDNHLILVDLSRKGLTGRDTEGILDKAGITVNKNVIPFDDKPPTVTSGIRIGTPALTTRGMGPDEMRMIAKWIDRLISTGGDEGVIREVSSQVVELCSAFPIYKDRI